MSWSNKRGLHLHLKWAGKAEVSDSVGRRTAVCLCVTWVYAVRSSWDECRTRVGKEAIISRFLHYNLGIGSYDAEMVAVDRSEKPMSEYFRILKANNEARLPKPWNPDEMMIYSSRYSWNMVTSKLCIDINTKVSPMHTLYDIARTSEVLVELECIPPEWLVDVEI